MATGNYKRNLEQIKLQAYGIITEDHVPYEIKRGLEGNVCNIHTLSLHSSFKNLMKHSIYLVSSEMLESFQPLHKKEFAIGYTYEHSPLRSILGKDHGILGVGKSVGCLWCSDQHSALLERAFSLCTLQFLKKFDLEIILC